MTIAEAKKHAESLDNKEKIKLYGKIKRELMGGKSFMYFNGSEYHITTPMCRVLSVSLDEPWELRCPHSVQGEKFAKALADAGSDEAQLKKLKVTYSVIVGLKKTQRAGDSIELPHINKTKILRDYDDVPAFITRLQKLLQKCMCEGGDPYFFTKDPVFTQNNRNEPISDGDLSEDENHHGHWIFKIRVKREYGSKNVVRIENVQGELISASEIYRGCFIRCSAVPMLWENSGFGYSLVLGPIRFLMDGDKIGGSSQIQMDNGINDDDFKVEDGKKKRDFEEIDDSEDESIF